MSLFLNVDAMLQLILMPETDWVVTQSVAMLAKSLNVISERLNCSRPQSARAISR
jgi:hypothetical protein